jgi:uncharacterized protein YoxC
MGRGKAHYLQNVANISKSPRTMRFFGSEFAGRSLVCYNSSGFQRSRRMLAGGGVNFFEQMPSKQWAALTFRGERIAEVWFKPEGEPLALVFRVPQSSFQLRGVGQRLTTETLLKAVAIAADEVESWHHEGASNSVSDGADPELSAPLPQPPHDAAHLEVHVRLKSPHRAPAREGCEPQIASAEWHDLEARWKSVLGVEATVDAVRRNMEGVRAELEAALRRTLTADEKVNALAADVGQLNKAKSRAHFSLPKASEYIHRATWAAGTPERKRLGEIFKIQIETRPSLLPADQVSQELENLRKDLQVLSAQGVSVCQECKTVLADVQGALRRLQVNAAVRASKKKGGTGAKGKSL